MGDSVKIVNIDKDKLKELYIDKKLTLKECGYKLGCSNVTINNKLIKYNIPTRTYSEACKGELRPYREKITNEILLKQYYIENKYSMIKCAGLLNCSNVTVKNKLVKLNIPIRGLKFNKGFKWSEEKKKIYGLKLSGKNNPMYGRRGKEAPNWKNGLSREPYPLEWRETLKRSIRQRDNHRCQLCGMPECENIRKLDVHHIDYDKKNLNPNNLISLCNKCHTKTNYNREYWTEYFKGELALCL